MIAQACGGPASFRLGWLQVGARALAGAFEGGDGFTEPAIARFSVLAQPRLGVFRGQAPVLVILAHGGGIHAPEQSDIGEIHVFLHAEELYHAM